MSLQSLILEHYFDAVDIRIVKSKSDNIIGFNIVGRSPLDEQRQPSPLFHMQL